MYCLSCHFAWVNDSNSICWNYRDYLPEYNKLLEKKLKKEKLEQEKKMSEIEKDLENDKILKSMTLGKNIYISIWSKPAYGSGLFVLLLYYY